MGYIDLVNRFWHIDQQYHFSATETRLYFALLHCNNRLGWKTPFGESDRYLSLTFVISRNTIRQARERLQQAGLIMFILPDKRGRGATGQTRYQLLSGSTTEPDQHNYLVQPLNQGGSNNEPVSGSTTEPNIRLSNIRKSLFKDEYQKERFNKLSNMINESFHHITKFDQPLTPNEADNLFSNYRYMAVINTLAFVNNMKTNHLKYISAYETLLYHLQKGENAKRKTQANLDKCSDYNTIEEKAKAGFTFNTSKS